ncbi:MAG: DUF488 family protein [Alphaproteobacteria bacterium]
MPVLIEKSAFAPAGKGDGLRLLVTRFKPFGLGKKDWHLWLADLAPSKALVKGFLAGTMSWKDFAARYKKEIAGQKSLLRTLRFLSGEGRPITLLCACDTPDRCHRRLLRDAIEKA